MLELITAKLKEKGLPEGLSIFISVETEEEIGQAVDNLAASMQTKDGLTGLLKTVGLDNSFTSVLNSEGDRRATQAVITHKMKQEPGKTDTPKNDPPGKQIDPTGTDAQIQALQAQIKTLTETVTGQVSQINNAQILTKVTTALKEAGLPGEWATRVTVESEDKIPDVVKGLKTEYDTIVQAGIDGHLEKQGLPKRPAGSASVSETVIKEFAESLKRETDSVPVQVI